jgi:type I restriction enzyme S subunit
MYGIVLPGPNVSDGVFIVKGGNCEPQRLRPECLSRTTYQIESRYVRSRLRENDIVYSIRGSIGSAQLVPSELAGANLTQDAARIVPGPGIDPEWLLYAVSSPSFFAKLDAGTMGAAVRGINIRDLKRGELAIPLQPEQRGIASFLTRELAAIDTSFSYARRDIELLDEFRTRLIADVVTGKLDVREAAALLDVEVEHSAATVESEEPAEIDQETPDEILCDEDVEEESYA